MTSEYDYIRSLASQLALSMFQKKKVQQMLGTRTPAQFSKLPAERRKAVFRSHLVQGGYVQIEEGDDDDFFNEDIADGALLRQEYVMGSDDTGKQLVKEAREIYYAENTFTVRSHWLCEFVRDTLVDGKPMAIEPLVRRIMVRVDVEHIHDMDNFDYMPEGETEKGWVVRDLRQLLAFTNTSCCRIASTSWESLRCIVSIVECVVDAGKQLCLNPNRSMAWSQKGERTSKCHREA